MTTPYNRRVLLIDDTPAIHGDFRKILAPAAGSAAFDEFESALFGSGTPADGDLSPSVRQWKRPDTTGTGLPSHRRLERTSLFRTKRGDANVT